MTFRKIESIEPVADFLARKLVAALAAGKHVLWLVPGGSAIRITLAVSTRLKDKDLHNLTVTLTDERFGPAGHPDSNWQQMLEGGLDLGRAELVPVLSDQNRDATAAHFADSLEKLFKAADYRLGFFGIGPDGHTAGILPGSPSVEATGLATGYHGGTFERVTMTVPAIARLDEAMVYAVGEPKWPVLDQLNDEVPLDQQPAQALKTVPLLTIFSDYKGDVS